MRGKYQRIRDAAASPDEPGSNKRMVRFSPGFMKYDGRGRFTFYRVKPMTIIKFIWSIFLHGKSGPRKT